MINLDEYESIVTHWIALYVNNNNNNNNNNDNDNDSNIIYFDSFGVEHIPKESKKFIGNKDVTTNIYRVQAYDSVMCGYFCIGFIDFMLKS